MANRKGVVGVTKVDKVYYASTDVSAPAAMNNIDTRDYLGVHIIVAIDGLQNLSEDNTVGWSIQHSDSTSGYVDVPKSSIEGDAYGDGELTRETSRPIGWLIKQFGYLGGKRYLRIGPKFRGTTGTWGMQAAVTLRDPVFAPTE